MYAAPEIPEVFMEDKLASPCLYVYFKAVN